MKQVLQDLKEGATVVADVPCPRVRAGELLIQSRVSLVSTGTERMLVEFGRAGLIDKARQQPQKVRQVLNKVRTDGILSTWEAVKSKLDHPLPLGYSNVGVVLEVGSGVEGFEVGDRVVSNGPHAEVVSVPKHLCAKIPDWVDDEQAVFTVIGAIGLQGIRLAQPTLGETFVVIGLGLIGLVTVQLLRANGCRVFGVDIDPTKVAMARKFGAEAVDLSQGEDPVAAAFRFSRGRGVDGVLITASTKSDQPIRQAAAMCRKRGRIVLVGVAGMALERYEFYKKELSFQVSCSYGPGRYDPEYELHGHDYPVGYVRWTEQRNFEAVLDMLAAGLVDCRSLISHRFPIERAHEAYRLLTTNEQYLGIILEYGRSEEVVRKPEVLLSHAASTTALAGDPIVSFIGAGNYASRFLIPAFKQSGVRLDTIVTSGGVSGVHHGRKHGFRRASTDPLAVIGGDSCNTVVIATRHDSHARYVCDALTAGKHVFVEKPLALSHNEIDAIEKVIQERRGMGEVPILMVGFNRRFAPHVIRMKALLGSVNEPKCMVMTVNAGAIPKEHWTQDRTIGGGRIIGEACHFIDLLRHLAGARIKRFSVSRISAVPGIDIVNDKATITLDFEDGSIGTVHYFANGHSGFPKERLEVFCAGRVLQLDNFRRLRAMGWPGFRGMYTWRQDKGQVACVEAFVTAIQKGEPGPISIEELLEVSRTVIDVDAELCREGC
ncbi:MAG: dehydrogenase [Acidobacteria bacterium]|nr:MAG: dehydrogenase [Acidobacteriota bacterium]